MPYIFKLFFNNLALMMPQVLGSVSLDNYVPCESFCQQMSIQIQSLA